MTRLLVSVRNVAEAAAALRGGAGLIDVKDPARGALGRADTAAITAVVREVAGRVPVSAALGELADGGTADGIPKSVRFVKWGLSGCAAEERLWSDALRAREPQTAPGGPRCRVVAVAYADSSRARSPQVGEVAAFARERPGSVFLLDTWGKDGSTLLDWLSAGDVARLREECRRSTVRVALGGSLGEKEFAALRGAAPDWFAVRGAACRGGRGGTVDAELVRRLARLLA